jgi:hypothetical protein
VYLWVWAAGRASGVTDDLTRAWARVDENMPARPDRSPGVVATISLVRASSGDYGDTGYGCKGEALKDGGITWTGMDSLAEGRQAVGGWTAA